ncbi:MAG: tetratricopeptide repeat protein [Cyanobacteria bacterium P01_G01_bin.39]
MLDTIINFINPNDKNKARKLYQKALENQNNGLNGEAINLLWEALKKDPTYSEAYNHIAWSYALANIYLIEAETLAHSAIKFAQNPIFLSAANNTLGEIYLRQNKIPLAIRAFQNSLVTVQTFESLYRLSFCHQISQDPLGAYQALIHAKELQTEHYVDVYIKLGHTCIALERYSEAIENFTFGLRISSHNFCYGLTDWGSWYEIHPGDVLNLRKCEILLGLGLAYFRLQDFISSKNCWKDANNIFPRHTYPLYNLACIASRLNNESELYCLLEKLMPLIVDQSYAYDPPNITNKVFEFSSSILIDQLLKEPDCQNHRDIVLEVLWKYKKITELFYINSKNNLTNKDDDKHNSGVSINIYNSTVGGFSVGDNSDISSDITLQKSSEFNPESVITLSNEVHKILNNVVKNHIQPNTKVTNQGENINFSNNLNENQTKIITSDYTTKNNTKKLKRNT